MAAPNIGDITGALQGALKKAFDVIVLPDRALKEGMKNLGAVADAAASGLARVTGAMQQFAGSYVALFNPAVMVGFKLAVDDMNASIGEALVPVMRVFTQLTRGVADVIARSTQPTRNLIAAMAAVAVGAVVVAAGMALISAAMATATAGISAIVGGLVAGAVTLAAVSGPMDKAKQIFDKFGALASKAMDAVGAAFAKVAAAGEPLIKVFLDLGETLLERLPDTLGNVIGIAEDLLKQIVPIVETILPPFMALAAALSDFSIMVVQVLVVALRPVYAALQTLGALLAPVLTGLAVAFEVVAVAGRTLAAVFDAVYDAIAAPMKALGDLFTQEVGPAIGELKKSLKDAGALLGQIGKLIKETVVEIFQGMWAVIKPFALVVKEVFVAVFERVANVIRAVAKFVRDAIDGIREFFGLERPADKPPAGGESQGKAVKNVQIGGVEAYLDRARSAAFSMGGAKDPKIQAVQEATNHLATISTFLTEKLKEVLRDVAREAKGEAKGQVGASAGNLAVGVIAGPTAAIAMRIAMRNMD